MRTGSLFLIALAALSVLAVATAKDAKWKLLNFAIILAASTAGITVGWLAGVWGRSDAIGADIALPLATGFSAATAFGCWRRNKMRDKVTKPNIITPADAAPPLETTETTQSS
jgi:hypothetical protein